MPDISISSSLIDSLRGSIAKESLKNFTHYVWSCIEPYTDIKWNWHLDAMCEALEAVHRGEIKRLIINVPPGTMKSLLVSVMFNAWEWTLDPSLRYLTFSYSDKNTIRDNRRLRTIIQSNLYQSAFPQVKLSSDQYAKVRFDTTETGFRIASSVGGHGLGDHPDRILLDDLLKASHATSIIRLDEAIEFIKTTVSTRIARNPAIISVSQRLNIDDPPGYLMSSDGWKEHDTICFPMRYAAARTGPLDARPIPDKRDVRTEPGELLWPEVFDEQTVTQEEIDLGPFGAAGQLDQNPIPEGGAEFKRTYFPIVDSVPRDLFVVRGWDAGGGEEGNDRSSGTKIGEGDEDDVYVLDSIVGNYGDAEYDELMYQTAQLDGKKTLVREEREPGSSGKSVTKAHARMLRGYDYAEIIVSGSKPPRRRPFRAQAQSGNVKLLRGPWNESYISAMCSLPFGKHDDEGDSSSCAYNAIVDERRSKFNPAPARRSENRRKKGGR